METKQLKQIESWFKKLNEHLVDTNRKLDNRFTALLQVCTNTRNDMESVKRDLSVIRKELADIRLDFKGSSDKQEARITAVELAVRELERRLSH